MWGLFSSVACIEIHSQNDKQGLTATAVAVRLKFLPKPSHPTPCMNGQGAPRFLLDIWWHAACCPGMMHDAIGCCVPQGVEFAFNCTNGIIQNLQTRSTFLIPIVIEDTQGSLIVSWVNNNNCLMGNVPSWIASLLVLYFEWLFEWYSWDCKSNKKGIVIILSIIQSIRYWRWWYMDFVRYSADIYTYIHKLENNKYKTRERYKLRWCADASHEMKWFAFHRSPA